MADPEVVEGFTKLFRPKAAKIAMDDQTVVDPKNKVHGAIQTCVGILKRGEPSESPLPDFTVMEVPSNFYSGSNNVHSLLKLIEDDYSVQCGFVQYGGPLDNSYVVIVGQLRPRRAAELKIMATIENKQRGFYSQRLVRDGAKVCDRNWLVATEDFDTDTWLIPERDLSFALGIKGSIRKKLAVASACILEYVGEVAYLSGTLPERTRGRDYLRWVLQQLEGEVLVGDYSRRIDISSLILSKRAAGFVNGNRGKVLRTIEELTGTFCFIARPTGDSKPLLVCGAEEGRLGAIFILERYVKQHQVTGWTDDAVEASLSSEMSRASLEELLKSNGLYNYRPTEPWKSGSNDASNYRFISQPCPGAARPDAVLLDSPSSSVLLRESRRDKSPGRAVAEFVNDEAAFPELGGTGKKPSTASLLSPPVKSAISSPVKVPSLPPPPPPPAVLEQTSPSPPATAAPVYKDAGIFFENGQVWGDWGLGPNGDPELGNDTGYDQPSAKWPGLSPQKPGGGSKLMGAWK